MTAVPLRSGPRRPFGIAHDSDHRLPPANLEAERSALSAAMVSADAAETLVNLLDPGAFYDAKHQHIADAICRLYAISDEVDPVTVGEQLRRTGLLEAAGGQQYLGELLALVAATSAIGHYCEIVRSTAEARKVIAFAADLADKGYQGMPAADVLAWAGAEIEARRALVDDRTGRRLRDRVLTIAGLRQLPPPQPLVDGMLDLDSFAVLFGPPGSAKSFAALDLALRVSTGTRWHGHQLVHQGPVVYVAAEGAHGLPARIDSWKQTTGRTLDPDGLHVLAEAVNLLDPAAVDEMAAYVAEVRPALVVVDTLARCLIGADENSSKDMSAAVAALDRIRRAAGCCVLVVHHTGKALEAGARGHSALLGAADTMLRVGMTDGIVALVPEKQKHHQLGNMQRFRLEPTGDSAALVRYTGTTDDDLAGKSLDALEALAQIEVPEGVPFGLWVTAGESLEISRPTTARARTKLLDRGLIEHTPEGTKRSPRYRLTDLGRSHLADTTESGVYQA